MRRKQIREDWDVSHWGEGKGQYNCSPLWRRSVLTQLTWCPLRPKLAALHVNTPLQFSSSPGLAMYQLALFIS